MSFIAGLTLLAMVSAQPLAFPREKGCDLPTDQEVALCTQKQAKAWDGSLNMEYKAALSRVADRQKPLLVEAQRFWVQYRDANCAVEFAHGGTISGYLGDRCILNMTRDRAKELHDLHTEDDN